MSMVIDSPSLNTLAADSDSGEAQEVFAWYVDNAFLDDSDAGSDCLPDDSATKYIHSTNLSYQNQTLIFR